jgi:hypothetical protein
VSSRSDPRQPGGEHRATDTDPVRRWDDNLYGLYRYLRWGLDLGGALVLAGGFLALTAVLVLWPGADIGLSDAAGRALVLVLGLFGLVILAVTAVSLAWSLVDAVVSLARLVGRWRSTPPPRPPSPRP